MSCSELVTSFETSLETSDEQTKETDSQNQIEQDLLKTRLLETGKEAANIRGECKAAADAAKPSEGACRGRGLERKR